MAYDPTTAGAALDAAVASLRTERKAAGDGGRDDVAAVLDQAIAGLRDSRGRLDAVVAFAQTSPRIAADALTAAGVAVARVDETGARVLLPSIADAVVVPAAQVDPLRPAGYVVQVVVDDGDTPVLSLRAKDAADMTQTVQRLIRQAS